MWAVLMAMAQVAGGEACAQSCLAWGDAPRWRLHDDRGRWALHVAGRPPLTLMPGAWRDTPAGRRVTGTAGEGRFTLLATFGACGGGGAGQPMRSSYFARLTLPDGRVLRGCMGAPAKTEMDAGAEAGTGKRPY